MSDVNLTIEQGMFGLLGRNGAGKTTLMKILATLLQKQGGSIYVFLILCVVAIVVGASLLLKSKKK